MRYDHAIIAHLLREAAELFPHSGKRFYTFISYTTREPESALVREIVSHVTKTLDARGIPTHESPFFHDGIFPVGGPRLERNIEDALRDSLQVSAYLSPEYFGSPICLSELRYGLQNWMHWIKWKECFFGQFAYELERRRGVNVARLTVAEAAEIALGATLESGNAILRNHSASDIL